MNEDLSLSDWNWATLMASQALWGRLSANMHRVDLVHLGDRWNLCFCLLQDDQTDREEADEAAAIFSASLFDLQDRVGGGVILDAQALIYFDTEQPLYINKDSSRLIVLMRTI